MLLSDTRASVRQQSGLPVAKLAQPVPGDIFVFVWEEWPYALNPPFYLSEQILFSPRESVPGELFVREVVDERRISDFL